MLASCCGHGEICYKHASTVVKPYDGNSKDIYTIIAIQVHAVLLNFPYK